MFMDTNSHPGVKMMKTKLLCDIICQHHAKHYCTYFSNLFELNIITKTTKHQFGLINYDAVTLILIISQV